MARLVKAVGPSVARVLVGWALEEIGRADQPFCWRRSYGRGAGKALSQCPGAEKNGALCYPKCRGGYKGVGPVCWQRCPSGFKDTGGHCLKPRSYGRGAGYALWAKKKCERKHGRCEKNGAMWYPRCRSGYHNVGCCVCSPNCTNGMKDIGVSCQKKSYGRGAGKPMKCRSDEEQGGGLCYPRCRRNFHGVGPVCWGNCPATQPHKCGAGCSATKGQCVKNTAEMVIAPLELAANIVGLVGTGGAANAAKASAKAAAKTASKQAAKVAAKKAVRDIARKAMAKVRKVLTKRLLKKFAKNVAEDVMKAAAESLAVSALSREFELEEFLADIDPTGIGAVVLAYKKPKCDRPKDAPDARGTVAAAPTSRKVRRTVSFRSAHGKYLVAEQDGRLNANRTRIGNWEKWTLVDLDGGKLESGDEVLLMSAHRRYLVAEANGKANANRPNPGPWETFIIGATGRAAGDEVRAGDRVAFRSVHGKYLVAESNGTANANRTRVGAWEQWVLRFH